MQTMQKSRLRIELIPIKSIIFQCLFLNFIAEAKNSFIPAAEGGGDNNNILPFALKSIFRNKY